MEVLDEVLGLHHTHDALGHGHGEQRGEGAGALGNGRVVGAPLAAAPGVEAIAVAPVFREAPAFDASPAECPAAVVDAAEDHGGEHGLDALGEAAPGARSPLDGAQLRRPQRKAMHTRILILDSLGKRGNCRVQRLLSDWLADEWNDRGRALYHREGDEEPVFMDHLVPCSGCVVPLQPNGTDCGLFMLKNMETFALTVRTEAELPVGRAPVPSSPLAPR